MTDYFNELPFDMKIYWGIAVFSTLIFVIQSILTFTGMAGGDGADGDAGDTDMSGDGEPFQLFTFRNLIHFLLGFSWTGVGFSKIIGSPIVLMLLAFAVGVLFIAVFFIVMKQMMKLAEDNSFQIKNILHQTAEIYIPVPAKRQGKGKISISSQGAIHEIDAQTDGERLATGTVVRVVGLEGESIAIVEKV